jgi:hypothetical protein
MVHVGRLLGEIFLSGSTYRVKGVWIRVAMSVMRHVGNQLRGFVKSRSSYYAVDEHSLIVLGSPSRLIYSQFAAGLP